MPATTFYDLWMGIRLYVPNASPFLIQRWMRNAFRELADRRQWSWQLIQGQIVWQDARDLTDVTTTFGSTTVTSLGSFLPADAGRSFRVGTYPIYTVTTYTDANTLILDRPYEGQTDGVGDAQILDVYATLPANFENFVMVLDPVNQRLVPWWATWEEMARLDPIRAAGGIPRLMGSAIPSTYQASLGRAVYEYYPKPEEHGALQYYAKALPIAMSDTDPIPGSLASRIDVLETHILMQAARWPGTTDLKNPYFNLNLARDMRTEFERAANQLDIRDDDLYQQSFDKLNWGLWSTLSWAFDTHLLQATDATIGDYYAGYGFVYY